MLVSVSGKEMSAPPIRVLTLFLQAKDALADMGIDIHLVCHECTRNRPGFGAVQGGDLGQGNGRGQTRFVLSCPHKEWVWERGDVL